jgi:hypothetical protein
MGHVGRAKGHIRGLRIACPRSRTQAGSMEREICVQDHDRPLRTRSAQPDLSSAPRAAAPVLVLQRQAGNHAVARLLHAGTGDHSAARPVGGQHLGLQRQADPEYVPDLGAPEHKPLPETKPEVLGRKDLDEILLKNTRLRTRIVSVATELDIDPGMLAASLFAEKGASAWSGTSGTVASEALGLDDWFGADVKPRLIRIINAHPGLGLRFDDVKATGETWDTSTEKAGGAEKPRGELDADKAVAAFGVYFKMQESVLQAAIGNKAKDLRTSPVRTLDDLTPEQRFTVLRVGLNAGVGTATKLFLRLARGGDIPRRGKTTRDPKNAVRTAALHVARAIHLAQAIFGRPSGDYRPAQAGITAEQAAVIFDRPELKNIPKRVVPFDYMWRIADVPPGQRRSWRPRPVHNTLN